MFKSSPIPVSPAGLRNLTLGVAGLAAAAFLVPSAASAAECVNGYRTLGNQVIVLCGEAARHADALALHGNAIAPAPETAVPHNMMAPSIGECRPGMYRSIENPSSGDQIIPC